MRTKEAYALVSDLPYEPKSVQRMKLTQLAAEIERLRQGLWDVCIEAGMDSDGDKTPEHLVYPDLVDLAIEQVRELRSTYEEEL